jgi:hypothetical protein
MTLYQRIVALARATKAREDLRDHVVRAMMPTSRYEEAQREALWDEYPKLSTLAYEVLIQANAEAQGLIDLGDGIPLTAEQAASRRAADEKIGKLARGCVCAGNCFCK